MSHPESPSDTDARMREFVSRHCRPLTRFISAMTPHRSTENEDLVQETMLRAWQNLDDLPADEQAGRYLDLLRTAAATDPSVGAAFLRVANMLAPISSLFDPALAARVQQSAAPSLP